MEKTSNNKSFFILLLIIAIMLLVGFIYFNNIVKQNKDYINKLENKITEFEHQSSHEIIISPNNNSQNIDPENKPLTSCQKAITSLVAASNLYHKAINGKSFDREIAILAHVTNDDYIVKNITIIAPYSEKGISTNNDILNQFNKITTNKTQVTHKGLMDNIISVKTENPIEDKSIKQLHDIELLIRNNNLESAILAINNIENEALQQMLMQIVKNLEILQVVESHSKNILDYLSFINYQEN
jgi:hypothetical protein